jgi:hypothetical protein
MLSDIINNVAVSKIEDVKRYKRYCGCKVYHTWPAVDVHKVGLWSTA